MSGHRRWLAAGLTVVSVAALLTAAGGGPAHAAEQLALAPVADTTFTQVTQDGDNGAKTTLATCPASCEGNGAGQRDAYVEFTVAGLPADARVTRATLELHAWNPYAARVTAYPADGSADNAGTWAQRPPVGAALATRTSVAAGYNAFDVTAAVTGNGRETFAVRQDTYNARVYWASRENANAAIRPRLLITYEPGTAPGDWRLVWEDNFDGTALDTAKWTARPKTYMDFDKACVTPRPENVFVSGGNLTIRAQREEMDCFAGGGVRQFTTAYLDTIGKATFGYGRFETRAKPPNGPTNSPGLWPAFWLRRTAVSGGGDPNDGNGEIDVMELPGGAQWYAGSTAAVWHSYNPPIKGDFRYDFPGDTYPGDGFHVYAMEWEPGQIRFFVDGRQVWQTLTPANTSWFTDVFNEHARYHLRLTFHVGGWLGDPDAATAFPADFQVDYVRVYRR